MKKLGNLPPPPSIPGVVISSPRDVGKGWIHEIAFTSCAGVDTVCALLIQFQPGDDVCFASPGPHESYLSARRTGTGFEIKTGFHGCHGSWRCATLDEAVEFLRPVLPACGNAHCRGSYTIYSAEKAANLEKSLRGLPTLCSFGAGFPENPV